MFCNTLQVIFDLLAEYILIIKYKRKSVLFRKPPTAWSQGSRGNVVIVPGFGETWTGLATIATSLNTRGYKIFIVHALGRNFIPLESGVRMVKDLIEQENLKNVVLLSHSKGGIIGKLLLDDNDFSKRIQQSISIAVPYKGSIFGYLRILSLAELIPGSKEIQRLNSITNNNERILNLYSKVDNHVIPNRNLILEGATNICIDIVGHTRILEAKETVVVTQKNMVFNQKAN
ncbi:hypothetical protein KA012_00780 [Candidatus Woesebacteria bacterium]|nr:hypothetical protein [Candidatus Woesebacteria bacterium]